MIRVLFFVITAAIFLALAIPVCAEEKQGYYKDGAVIAQDTSWFGRIEVDGVVLVPEGVTLTIAPGTVVAFRKSAARYKEEGGEGSSSEVLIPGSGIRVEGKVIAVGEKGKEIAFTSAERSPSPGAWGCMFLDHSKGSFFKRCIFEYSAYTLHSHFSQFDVSRCIIRHNEDGSRLGVSRVTFDHCDIYRNTGKGLNFRQCRNSVTWCSITGNRDGIFLNEKDAACTIENNNIHDNTGMDLRLGDFHAEDITLKGNWWGTAEASLIARKVWDREDDANIGRAVIEPAKAEVIGAGVDGIELKVLWKFKTDGFVDCNPAVDNGIVYFGSWDKKFYAVNEKTGEPVWSFQTGDCVDSSPAVYKGRVFFGSWDRNIYCLDAKDGKLIWEFEMPPSNFDDHRQASPAVYKNVVFMGGFNGMVYALNAETGSKTWEFQTGGPIRNRLLSSPSWSPSAISDSASPIEGIIYKNPCVYVGSGDGSFYSLSSSKVSQSAKSYPSGNGELIWKFATGGAINSSPALDNPYYILFFGSRDGDFYCINEFDCRIEWRYKTGSRIEYSSPLIAGRIAVIGDCSGTLHAVDKFLGQKIWKFTGGGGIYSSPKAVKDSVVYGDNAGNVYCLDLKTGRPLGLFRAGDAVQGLSTGPDGTIYAGSRDGYLYALSLSQ